MIAVLGTGAFSALSPADARSRARLRAVRRGVNDVVVPAAVLAEGVLTGNVGHDYHVLRLLDLVADFEIDRELGLAAGALRQQAMASGSRPSGVGAIVAAVADRLAVVDDVLVITSDVGDLQALVSFTLHNQRISLLGV